MGSVGFIFERYMYIAVACGIAGSVVGLLEWLLSGGRISWKSFLVGLPFALLVTGGLSTVLIDVWGHGKVPSLHVFAQSSWMIGLVSIVPYIPVGLLSRFFAVSALEHAYGPKQ